MISIYVTSILVEDQVKALEFYTQKLGFIKKTDVPIDGTNRWLTVVPKQEQNGTELLLEPMGIEEAKFYQKSLKEKGIPITSLQVDDLKGEYDRLKKEGVEFTVPPTEAGNVLMAIFDDTCGNNIQLVEIL